MGKMLHVRLTELTGLLILAAVLYMVWAGGSLGELLLSGYPVPASLLRFNTVFLSILIEAVPFVLIGVLIAGLIQIFVTEDHIRRWMPRNRFMAVLVSCLIGALFPACECGIVPIVRRLVGKGVPVYAAIGFMLTGPLINPIVIFSTYMAFGNDARMAALRMGLGFAAAVVAALAVSLLFRGNQLKISLNLQAGSHAGGAAQGPLRKRIGPMLRHSVDEFFDVGKYLILGALVAAWVQTYVSAQSLLAIGDGAASSSLVMMGLAYLLSLCSEADAFIAASFRHLFPVQALLSFLIFGPMIDLKNTFMLAGVFKLRFVAALLGIVAAAVFGIMTAVQGWL